MEVQPPQSVQINFNNKIITLHNVTIVKNPKIITIDATQYSNFLKGSPVKLSNGTTTTNKLQMPSLIPVNKNQQQAFTFKPNGILNHTPVANQVPKLTQQVIRTANGIAQLKSTPFNVTPTSVLNSSLKLQTLPVRQQPKTVIISPPKVSLNNATPIRYQLTTKQTSGSNPTYMISKQPIISNGAVASSSIQNAAPTRVIISPPSKNKISPCTISPPDAKKFCKRLDFHCIYCKNVYNDSSLLVDHLKTAHIEDLKQPKIESNFVETKIEEETPTKETIPEIIEEVKEEPKQEVEVKVTSPTSTKSKPPSPTPIEVDQISAKKEASESENSENEQDDDESEVNDLIMDLEETQDTAASTQDRSETPESPEFEEHVISIPVKLEPIEEVEAKEISSDDDFDFAGYEYYSSIMEPICELSCEDDSNDGVQDENEAMRLYREAMEVNYQQNGIKKRGRRKQQKAKPLVENTTSLNGILAGLLENSSIKVPPGPGRGRRKEINEQELEMDRSNGICLFSCNKCDESFKYAGDLAKHVRSHTISSPYQCSICQRKFTHIGSLNTHLRIHSGERPYKCNQCDKSFTQSNSLMVHVKSHLSNKPFQCHMCNKGFLNASSLALHTKTHTGPTTVTCLIETCKKEFRDNNLLEEHMMTHRQSMLYQCSLCSEKFEQSCLLVQHVKSHIGDKPFQCNQCGKCFTQPGSLNTHLRIHTGEKPFECNICGKKFTQASSLSVHMKVHGEKEFKCVLENCKKSYSQEAYLKKHMLKHIESSLNDENNRIAQE